VVQITTHLHNQPQHARGAHVTAERSTDDDFVVKRREIEERRRCLEERLRAAEHSAGELGAQLQAVFDFAARAPETFRTGTPVQQRMILEAAGLNYTLTARKVALEWNKPLNLVARAAAYSIWSAQRDSNFNFLRNSAKPWEATIVLRH